MMLLPNTKWSMAASILLAIFVASSTLAELKQKNKTSLRSNEERDHISKVNTLVEYFENLRINEESKSLKGRSRSSQNEPLPSIYSSDIVINRGAVEPREIPEITKHQVDQGNKVADNEEITVLTIDRDGVKQGIDGQKEKYIMDQNVLSELQKLLDNERTLNKSLVKQLEEMSQSEKESQKFLDEVKSILEKERVENRNTLKHLTKTSLKEKSELEESLKEIQKGLDNEREKNENLIEKLENMSMKETETQKTLNELQEFLQNEQKEKANLKEQLDELTLTNEKATETERFLNEIQELLEKERIENRNTLKRLRELSLKDNEAGESVKELQKALDFEQTEKRNLVLQLEEMSSRRHEAEASHETNKEKVIALENGINNIKQIHQDEIRSLSSQYEQKLSIMKNNLDAMNKEMEGQDKLIANLSTTSVDAKNKLKQKERELNDLMEVLSKNKGNNSDQSKELRNSYEIKLSMMEKQVANMQECKTQLTETSNSLNRCEAIKQSSLDKAKELNKQILLRNSDVEKCNKYVENLKKEVDRLKETKKDKSPWYNVRLH